MKLEGGKRKLPDGWRWVKLGDVCEFVGGMQPPKYVFQYEPLPGYVRLVQIQDFRRSDVAVYIPAKEAKRTFDESDVMIGRYGPPLFQILRGLSGAYNVALIKTVPKTNLLKDYLYYLLQEPTIQNAVIAQSQRSAGQTGVQKEFLERLEVPLPPMDEQKRIAAILNEKMEAVERSRQATLAQLEAAKALSSAYLRAVFNSPEAQKWQKKKLGEVGKIVSGITLGRKINNPNTRPVPYLRVANVKDSYLDLSSVYKIEATESEIEKLRLKFGDILLTEGGDPDKLDRGTYWKEQISECIHQNHIFRVRFDFNEFCPEFISAQLGSLYGKAYFFAHAKQTTGIATINQQVISNFPLMIPPLSEQKQIAATFSEQMAEVEKLRKSLEEQLDAINKLPAAFLRQAFNGEL